MTILGYADETIRFDEGALEDEFYYQPTATATTGYGGAAQFFIREEQAESATPQLGQADGVAEIDGRRVSRTYRASYNFPDTNYSISTWPGAIRTGKGKNGNRWTISRDADHAIWFKGGSAYPTGVLSDSSEGYSHLPADSTIRNFPQQVEWLEDYPEGIFAVAIQGGEVRVVSPLDDRRAKDWAGTQNYDGKFTYLLRSEQSWDYGDGHYFVRGITTPELINKTSNDGYHFITANQSDRQIEHYTARARETELIDASGGNQSDVFLDDAPSNMTTTPSVYFSSEGVWCDIPSGVEIREWDVSRVTNTDNWTIGIMTQDDRLFVVESGDWIKLGSANYAEVKVSRDGRYVAATDINETPRAGLFEGHDSSFEADSRMYVYDRENDWDIVFDSAFLPNIENINFTYFDHQSGDLAVCWQRTTEDASPSQPQPDEQDNRLSFFDSSTLEETFADAFRTLREKQNVTCIVPDGEYRSGDAVELQAEFDNESYETIRATAEWTVAGKTITTDGIINARGTGTVSERIVIGDLSDIPPTGEEVPVDLSWEVERR